MARRVVVPALLVLLVVPLLVPSAPALPMPLTVSLSVPAKVGPGAAVPFEVRVTPNVEVWIEVFVDGNRVWQGWHDLEPRRGSFTAPVVPGNHSVHAVARAVPTVGTPLDKRSEPLTMTVAGPPPAPANLTATLVPGQMEVNLAWDALPQDPLAPTLSWRIETRAPGGAWTLYSNASKDARSVTARFFDAVGLQPELRVRAERPGQASAWAAVAVQGEAPGPLSDVQVWASEGWVWVGWAPSATGGPVQNLVLWVDGQPALTTRGASPIQTLRAMGAHVYAVQPVNLIGAGPVSDGVPLSVSAPSVPRALNVTARTAPVYGTPEDPAEGFTSEVRLKWQAPETSGDGPILGYRIWRQPAGGEWTLLAATTRLDHTDLAVEEERAYAYRVEAYSDYGAGPSAGATVFVPLPDQDFSADLARFRVCWWEWNGFYRGCFETENPGSYAFPQNMYGEMYVRVQGRLVENATRVANATFGADLEVTVCEPYVGCYAPDRVPGSLATDARGEYAGWLGPYVFGMDFSPEPTRFHVRASLTHGWSGASDTGTFSATAT